MLKKQHQFSARLTGEERQEFRTHMCGLCHALGDQYGHLSRLLTSGEMILLNMLTSAQTPTDPEIVLRRCPINPTRHVRTNQDTASEFAAQVAVSLAQISVTDDLTDDPGPRAHLANRLLHNPARAAKNALENLGFDVATLDELTASQSAAENNQADDPTSPSAMMSARLFAHTATLANLPENAEPLAIIGANYGAYVYLMDAYTDYADDMVEGTFNPLRDFSQDTGTGFTLSPAGQEWLLTRFEAIHAAILENLPLLNLYRYQTTLAHLLTEPVEKVIAELNRQLAQQKTWQYRRWKAADVLKAALFILPTAAAAKGITAVTFGSPEELNPLTGRRRQRRNNCTDDCDLYFCSTGNTYDSSSSADVSCASGIFDATCGSILGNDFNLGGCGNISNLNPGCDAGDAGGMVGGCLSNMDCNGMDACDAGGCDGGDLSCN